MTTTAPASTQEPVIFGPGAEAANPEIDAMEVIDAMGEQISALSIENAKLKAAFKSVSRHNRQLIAAQPPPSGAAT